MTDLTKPEGVSVTRASHGGAKRGCTTGGEKGNGVAGGGVEIRPPYVGVLLMHHGAGAAVASAAAVFTSGTPPNLWFRDLQ